MGAAVLLMANAEGDAKIQTVGVTGLHGISRVFGGLLSALAIQFIFDGISQSGSLA